MNTHTYAEPIKGKLIDPVFVSSVSILKLTISLQIRFLFSAHFRIRRIEVETKNHLALSTNPCMHACFLWNDEKEKRKEEEEANKTTQQQYITTRNIIQFSKQCMGAEAHCTHKQENKPEIGKKTIATVKRTTHFFLSLRSSLV